MAGILSRNRDRADAIRREIASIEAAIAADRAAGQQLRRLAATRAELLDDLAEQEAAGTVTRDEVDARLEEFDRGVGAHLRNAEARERAAVVREQELGPLRRELEQVAFDEQLEKTSTLARARARAEAAVPKAIAAALETLRTAAAAVEAEAEGLDELEELRPDGEERVVDVADSPDWPADVGELVELLEVGPRQPRAKADKIAAKVRRDIEVRANSDARSLVQRHGGRTTGFYRELERYSEDFKRRAIAVAERVERDAQQRAAAGKHIELAESGFPVGGSFVRLDP